MANIFDAANFFIETANNSNDDFITNLKLNKLLYFANGIYLARTGKPLFNNSFYAWRYGPVAPEIYSKYKVCGKNPIFFSDDEYDSNNFTDEELKALIDAEREYGIYTGEKLTEITHQTDTPWTKAYIPGVNNLISAESIQKYFVDHPVKSFSASSLETVSVLPKEWYDPNEDAEWESYRG